MYGENPEGSLSTERWIAYILSSFLINIVGLNLLISIITENYGRVTSKLNSIDYKARLEQIRKVERSLQKINTDLEFDYSRKFLHIVKYAEDQDVDSALSNKLKEVKYKMDQLHDQLNNSKIHERYEQIHNLIKDISDKHGYN